MSIFILILIVLLFLSGFFDLIPWAFNFVAIVALGVFGVIAAYNSLIRSRNRVSESWSDIEVQLKRRYDLIPNLVNTVKGYASHEKETFDRVIQARSAAMGAKSVPDHAQAENMLTGALRQLFALAEAYPQLRAVEAFKELQTELTDTENKIQAARRFYNSNVLDLNNHIEQFPTNLIAGMFNFKKGEFFDLETEEEKRTIQVKF